MREYSNERAHIIECINTKLASLSRGSDKWWDYWRWCRDRVDGSTRIGALTTKESMELMAFLNKLENKAHLQLSFNSGDVVSDKDTQFKGTITKFESTGVTVSCMRDGVRVDKVFPVKNLTLIKKYIKKPITENK